MRAIEYFPVIDESGNTIGKATRYECHNGSKILHPVVHLHIFNERGDLFLQKRSEQKDIQPGKWDTAVGGHVNYGEKIKDALFRESREELGIFGFEAQLWFHYIFESDIERELVSSYRTIYNGVIVPDLDEVTEGRFWTISEIKNSLERDIFTPNFEYEFSLMKL